MTHSSRVEALGSPLRVRSEETPWEAQAACNGMDPTLFFGSDQESKAQKRFRVPRAKAVCSTCPVQAQCLDTALANDERFGIWGGRTYAERKKLRRRRPHNRTKTHCLNDHPLSGDNLYVDPKGARKCRECAAARVRAYKRKKRAEA